MESADFYERLALQALEASQAHGNGLNVERDLGLIAKAQVYATLAVAASQFPERDGR